MCFKNTAEKFGVFTRFFHWSLFILYCIQIYLASQFDKLSEDSPEFFQNIVRHESVGVLILTCVLLLLVSRHFGTRPPYLGKAKWELILSKSTHVLLYLSFIAMPIAGMLMSMFAGYDVSFFSWTLPNPLPKNEMLSHFSKETHFTLAVVIFCLVSLHIAAALFHQFIRKDGVMKRMLPW